MGLFFAVLRKKLKGFGTVADGYFLRLRVKKAQGGEEKYRCEVFCGDLR